MGDSNPQYARLACSTCRRQKRKCSRELPSCQLCLKNRRQCDYPVETPSGCQEGEAPSHASQIFNQSNLFPPLFFLDSYAYEQRRSVTQFPPIVVPREFRELIDGDSFRLHQLTETFFMTVHKFFPIVSKKRLYQKISTNDHDCPDIILLLHSIHAVRTMDEPGEGSSRNVAYSRAKHLFCLLESRGILTVRTIQAGLLLALYEIANSIYPAAFLTVGHCARIGHALGIHDRRNARQMFQPPTSWTEMEENRRTWWGVIILDRFVNIGLGDRPFACADARPEDLLPMDEDYWELGEQTIIPSLAVSGDTTHPAPAFARTCQAAHLLSRVLSNINPSNTGITSAERYMEAIQLHAILTSFKNALEGETKADDAAKFTAYSTAQGICYSALIALCDNYSCAEQDDPLAVGTSEQLQIQEVALRGLHEVGQSVCQLAAHINAIFGAGDCPVLSPFVAQCLYAASKQYWWYIQETGKTELLGVVSTLTSALLSISQRWRVAGEYLSIMESEGIPPATETPPTFGSPFSLE